MKILGNSLHIANSGKLIARSNRTPSPGAIVYNSRKKKIGKINHVFGPTKNPYISIRLFKSIDKKEIENNAGEKLFVSKPKSKKRRMKPRHKR